MSQKNCHSPRKQRCHIPILLGLYFLLYILFFGVIASEAKQSRQQRRESRESENSGITLIINFIGIPKIHPCLDHLNRDVW